MDMTVIVTRNVPDRFRGFLASCMLEVAPGVYTSPRMSEGVRERVWAVCEEWGEALPADGGILLTWRDAAEPSGQGLRTLGWTRSVIVDHDGAWLARRDLGMEQLPPGDEGSEGIV
jgi:CRISPR-associated protein Cas2